MMKYSGARLHNCYTDVNRAAQALSPYGGVRARGSVGMSVVDAGRCAYTGLSRSDATKETPSN